MKKLLLSLLVGVATLGAISDAAASYMGPDDVVANCSGSHKGDPA